MLELGVVSRFVRNETANPVVNTQIGQVVIKTRGCYRIFSEHPEYGYTVPATADTGALFAKIRGWDIGSAKPLPKKNLKGIL